MDRLAFKLPRQIPIPRGWPGRRSRRAAISYWIVIADPPSPDELCLCRAGSGQEHRRMDRAGQDDVAGLQVLAVG